MNKIERLFLNLVKRGMLQVFKNGLIINTKTGNHIGQKKNGKYQRIGFKIKGKSVGMYVHRLIWIVFKGPIPHSKEINHKSGVKHENAIRNLECVTASKNIRHAIETGLFIPGVSKGSDNGSAILTEQIVRKIVRLRTKFSYSYSKLAKRFNVTKRTIANILTGKNWKHLSLTLPFVKSSKVLTKKLVAHIRRWYSNGHSMEKIAKHLGIGSTTVRTAIRKKMVWER